MAIATVATARAAAGMPHWLVIDEAHHVMPSDGSPATDMLKAGREPICLTTLTGADLAPEALAVPTAVASTDLAAFDAALQALGAAPAAVMLGREPLQRGEAALAWLEGTRSSATRFQVARRRVEHRRHVRKYTEGELPPERSFFFRGPDAALNLRAANLVRFCELAEGVEERRDGALAQARRSVDRRPADARRGERGDEPGDGAGLAGVHRGDDRRG
jgi:hypothetical protein